jgi:hypothetical protein
MAQGQLFNACQKIDQAIKTSGLDAADVRGKIVLRTGVLFSLIRPETPDDPAKFEKLKKAAFELLKVAL